jgi:hypothetical protein
VPVGALAFEVARDHLCQLLQSLENREVQVGAEVGREDETVVAVDDERPHCSPAHALAASLRLRSVWIITFASIAVDTLGCGSCTS